MLKYLVTNPDDFLSIELTLVRRAHQTRSSSAITAPKTTAPLRPTGQEAPQQGHAAPEK